MTNEIGEYSEIESRIKSVNLLVLLAIAMQCKMFSKLSLKNTEFVCEFGNGVQL